MVKGLDLFRDKFADFSEQYVLIGGTAAYLLLDKADLQPRATKDLDIVLCVEATGTRIWGGVLGVCAGRRLSEPPS